MAGSSSLEKRLPYDFSGIKKISQVSVYDCILKLRACPPCCGVRAPYVTKRSKVAGRRDCLIGGFTL
jgi:hypothetical protein